jgi:magnesium transporter
MPELGWYFGYPMAILLMVAVAAALFVYFKRKHYW